VSRTLQQFKQLLHHIHSGQIAPFYLFYGEESYFIEKLVQALIEKVVDKATREFNYETLVATDIEPQDLIATLRSYPMLGEKRLVILQNTEKLGTKIHTFFEPILPLIENEVPFSILVITHLSRNLPDQRRKWVKTLLKKAQVFESKPLYENQLEPFVKELAQQLHLQLTSEAAYIFIHHVGANLYKLEDELIKLKLYLHDKPQIQKIDSQLIVEFTAMSKEFNIFELLNSIGIKNGIRSYFISEHLLSQTQEYALGPLLAQLFQFFSRLLFIKKMGITDLQYLQAHLNLPPTIAKSYLDAAKRYSIYELEQNIHHILHADLKLKGLIPSSLAKKEVFRDLILRIVS